MPSRGCRIRALAAAALFLTGLAAVIDVPTAEAQVSEVVWSTDQYISTDFTVPSDTVLKVQAGVNVNIDPDVNITVYGNITATGTAMNPVFFTWNQSGSRWGSINLVSTRERSHFHHAYIHYATEGIYAYDSDLHIEDSNISFCKWNGTHVYNGDVDIIDSAFVQNGQDTTKTDGAIYLTNATGLVHGNNILDNNNGVFMKEGSEVTVTGNYIYQGSASASFGVLARSGSVATIHNNEIWHNYFGIVSNASMCTITNNTIYWNDDDGVLLVEGDDSYLEGNEIRENGDEGVDVSTSSTAELVDNSIHNNTDKGILVWSSFPHLEDNDIYGNGVGLRVSEGGNATSSGNDIHDNTYEGIQVDGLSTLISTGDDVEDNGGAAVVADNSTAYLSKATIGPHGKAVMAIDNATVILENGTVAAASDTTFTLDDSDLFTINNTMADRSTHWENTSTMTISWYLGVQVLDEDGHPFPGVEVIVVPSNASIFYGALTDDEGKADWFLLMERHETRSGGTVLFENVYTPYTINISYGGHSNETTVQMDRSRNVTKVLQIPNNAPVLSVPIPDNSFPEDTDAYGLIDLDDHFTDEGPMTYHFVFVEDDQMIDGIVNGSLLDFTTPTENWYGTMRFRVRAMDIHGKMTESNDFNITVTPVNDPPLMGAITEQTTSVNTTLTFTMTASDVDNPKTDLTFRTDFTPPPTVYLMLDPFSGVVTFRAEEAGTYIIPFYACDPEPLCSEEAEARITVTQGNTPPRFTTTPPRNAYIEVEYTYVVGTTDDDGDVTTLVLVDGPAGLELEGDTVTWTPDATKVGQHTVTLRLSDPFVDVYQNFTISVLAKNHPPEAEILSPADKDVFGKGENISFQGRAYDLDGDDLSYTWRIDGSVLSNDLGFSTALPVGTHSVSFGVSDGSVTAYHNLTVTVKGGVTPPPGPHDTTMEDALCFLGGMVVLIIGCAIITVFSVLRHRAGSRPPPRRGRR